MIDGAPHALGVALAGGVNWTLLGIGIAILVGGGVALFLMLRSGKKKAAPARFRTTSPGASSGRSGPVADAGDARKSFDEAMSRGDFEGAAMHARRLKDGRLYAQAVEKTGDLERAIKAWVEAGDLHRAAGLLQDGAQWGKAARLWVRIGDHRAAVDCFLKAGEKAQAANVMRQLGDEQGANLLSAEAAEEAGDHMEAARFYVKAREMVKAAQALIRAGDMKKAVEALRRAGQFGEAARLFVEQGEFEQAARLYEEAKQWKPAADCYGRMGDIQGQARCLAHGGQGYQAGRLAFEKGDFDRALQYFEALAPLDEHFADAGLFRGQIYERRGELQESADAYLTFLKDREPDTKNKVLFLRVAQIQEGIGRLRAALTVLGRLISGGLGTPDVVQWASRLEQSGMAEFETEAMDKSAGQALATMQRAPLPRRATRTFGVSTSPDLAPPPRMPEAQKAATPPPSVTPAAPPPADLPALQALGKRYEFKGQIGQGGNGVVYRAVDRKLGRDVVVKFLHQALLPTEVARKYFEREAKTAASLTHANIVTIFDIGQEEDTLFFSMELVEGQTLADLIVANGGTLEHQVALPLITQLCSALDYAHEKQIIHRDIKPGNIMVTRQGAVKLLDFGLAKALDENPDKSVFLCGTPFYMSPEQIRRDFLDHRTDIYSLGCLLYVIYTGDVPFPEGNVFYHHQHTAPPAPDDLKSGLYPGVSDVLLKTVCKDRALRFQRARDVAAALAAL